VTDTTADTGAAEGDTNLSAAHAEWRATRSAAARAILEADERVFIHQALSTPCLDVIDRAEGASLFDIDGREILDFHGNSVHQVGYGHPKVVAAIKAALDSLPFCPRRYTNRFAVALAERLISLAPEGLSRVLFAPSGAAAIGMALKLARYATGRHKTLSMWDSFHGANLDGISVGGEALFRRGVGPLLPGAEHVPPLDRAEALFGGGPLAYARLADYIDYILSTEGDFAAVVAEPMRWTTITPPPAEFWPRVRQSCDRNGTLLVFDEIPSCLGRTGTMFYCDQVGAAPDILAIGKGLGGGVMPMAAILARGDLRVPAETAIGHYTHEKSPVGAAAALATLEVIAEERLLERSRDLGRRALGRLVDIALRHRGFAGARGVGLALGLELAGPAAHERAERMLYASLARGLSFKIGAGRVVTLTPPLNIAEHQLDRALDIVGETAAGL
jgi:4-aminobutyrate aminotransferase